MATPTGTEQELKPLPEQRGDDDRAVRRMLRWLLAILVLGALGLVGLLVWLLRPEPGPAATGQPGGYPIEVVTTIYGFGEAPEELIRTPLGVAFDGLGDVWVSNSGQARVETYTSDGEFIRIVGDEEGPGQLLAPYGIAIDQERARVYVADFAAGMVQIFTTEGSYVGHLPSDEQDLAVFGPDGFSPYDVQIYGGRVVVSSNDGLYFFDLEGHVVDRWGGEARKGTVARGSGWGELNFPDAFTIDRETGTIYVADTMNRRVVAIDANGNWTWVSGRSDENGQIRSFWQLPRGIALGPDGNLYVVDTFRPDAEGMGTGHLVVLSKDGELLSEFGRTGSDDGAFRFPEHIAKGPDDLWALADRENGRIVVFRLLTPYPQVDDLLARRYPKGFANQEPQPVG